MEMITGDAPDPEYLLDEEEIHRFLQYADPFPVFAFDTESTGKDPPYWQHKAIFITLAVGQRRVLVPSLLYPELKPLFECNKFKVGHNIKFDMHMLAGLGVDIQIADPLVDTAVMSIRESSVRLNHKLKYLCADGLFKPGDPEYVQYPEFGELFPTTKGRNKISTAEALLEPSALNKLLDYATLDAWCTLSVFKRLVQRLRRWPSVLGNLWDLYKAHEIPMTRVLYEYERAGFLLDTVKLSQLRQQLDVKIQDVSTEVSALLGRHINIGSNQQLAQFLFDEAKLAPVRYTNGGKTGKRQPTVDDAALTALAGLTDVDPRVKKVIEYTREYRVLTRMRSTYASGMLNLLDPANAVHTTYNQGGAETTRLSSAAPNLQNIPSNKDVFGLRAMFVAPANHSVICFDLDQVEMKILADRSKDQKMIDAINNGLDVHSTTVAMVEGVDYEIVEAAKRASDLKLELTPVQKQLVSSRKNQKKIGFGIAYGATAMRLCAETGCTYEEGVALRERWLDQYDGVRRWTADVLRRVTTQGYTSTIMGWLRHFPAAKLLPGETVSDRERDPVFSHSVRAAGNHEIQGTAADILRAIMILNYNDQELRDMGWSPRMTVHDEILGVAPLKNKDAVLARCLDLAKDPLRHWGVEFAVPITASGGTGPNWKAAK